MRTERVRRLILAMVVTATIVALWQTGPGAPLASSDASRGNESVVLDDDDIAFDTAQPPSNRPTVEAVLRLQSYRPGDKARLAFFSSAAGVSIQILRAGTETHPVVRRDVMAGNPVTTMRRIGRIHRGGQMSVAVGNWPIGLYFARLTAPGRVGYAPFVLRPRRVGEHRIAVVLPTLTWQAYNFRDDDGNGTRDTWYADRSKHTVHLARPFENRGTPRHYGR